MNPYSSIQLVALGLGVGDTTNDLVCPWCQGGRSSERSFYVSYHGQGKVAYVCHRASCGKQGYVPLRSSTSAVDTAPSPAKFEANPHVHPTVELGQEDYDSLQAMYGVTPRILDRFEVKKDSYGRLVLPVFSPQRRQIGCVTREVLRNGKKRVLSWKVADEPWQCWYTVPGASALVIVEDQISALRLCQEGVSALALLGTLLSPEKTDQIRKYFVDPHLQAGLPSPTIVLALDKDATSTAIRYRKQYGGYLGNFNVIFLSKDIKNLPENEVLEFIGGIVGS